MTTARRVAAAVVTAVALAVIVWGVAVGDDRPANRVEALASELRCPVCQGESIADSAAELARDYRQLIADEVAAGSTDAEITQLFVARYGDWVLLDPPARGRTLLLWVLPVVALVVGIVAIATRKRPAPTDLDPEAKVVAGEAPSRGSEPVTADAPAPQSEDEGRGGMTDRSRLEEQRDLARRELTEVGDQLAAGEIDEETANRLRTVYAGEAASAEAELAALDDDQVVALPGRSRRRAIIGTVLVVVAGALVVFGVARAVQPRGEGETVTGGIVDDVVSGAPLDLETVSNEQMEAVVAENPDVVAMRLALARRYVEAGAFSEALGHYMIILEDEPEPEALAYVGWISFLSDEADLGARYLEQSLELSPQFRLAEWFLANVRIVGLDDPAGAVPLLESLLADPQLPDDIRAEAEALLAQAGG